MVVLSSQISGILIHRYLWNEAIIALDFLHSDNYQRKLASKSTIVDWEGPEMPSYV